MNALLKRNGRAGLLAMWLAALSPALLAAGLTDPTQPADNVLLLMPEGEQAQAAMLKLSGVQENGKGSVAIINNTMVRVGDQIQGYTLVSVKNRRAVLVDARQQPLELTMALTDYRKPVAVVGTKKKQKHKRHSVKQAAKLSAQ